MDKLLEIVNLKTYFYTGKGVVPAVDDVSFYVNRGETLCIVGESGCGKSVTAMSIMQLVPSPPGKYVQGQILFEGKNLLERSNKEMTNIPETRYFDDIPGTMTALNRCILSENRLARR